MAVISRGRSTSIGLRGADEVEAVLKQLPDRVAKNVVIASLRGGARVIAKQARANVRANPSIDSALLEKNITSQVRKKSKRGSAVVAVGVRNVKRQVVRKGRKKAMLANPSKYAHLVELGTKTNPAEPFLRPAVDEKGAEAISTIGKFMLRGIDREVNKLASGKTSFVTGKRIR